MGDSTQQAFIPARQDGVARHQRPLRPTIGNSLAGKNNALNFVRLMLAASVLVSHSGVLGGFQPIANPNFGPIGGYAVYGFFAISGYLIANSRMRMPILPYLWHRVIRIMPAFWVCIILTAFVFAPFAAWMLGEHWQPLSSVGYVLKNSALLMVQGGIHDTLLNQPNPITWNGSLWTLFYEFACYVGAAAVLSIPFVRKNPVPWLAGGLLAVGCFLAISDQRWDALRLASFFLAGMLFYFLRDRIPMKAWIAAASVVVFAAFYMLGIAPFFGQIFFAYVMFWLGAVLPTRIGSRNDVSYGVYIYGWPVQQIVTILGGAALGHAGHFAVSFIAVVGLGWLSWKLVESPALRFKDLFTKRRTL
jgi:peptidoglycan/LPS O-acetylase OafA/YrhL